VKSSLHHFQKEVLKAHNGYRKLHCASALRLDRNLNKKAQKYAQHLADIDQRVHSHTKGVGENLYMR
jgi:uncharacterized protein YkwD